MDPKLDEPINTSRPWAGLWLTACAVSPPPPPRVQAALEAKPESADNLAHILVKLMVVYSSLQGCISSWCWVHCTGKVAEALAMPAVALVTTCVLEACCQGLVQSLSLASSQNCYAMSLWLAAVVCVCRTCAVCCKFS